MAITVFRRRKRRTRSKTRRRKSKKRRRKSKRRTRKSKRRRKRRRTKRGGTCMGIDRKRGESKGDCMRRLFKKCVDSKSTPKDGNPDHHHITCIERYPNKNSKTKKEWNDLIKTWNVVKGKHDEYGKRKKGYKQWHASRQEL